MSSVLSRITRNVEARTAYREHTARLKLAAALSVPALPRRFRRGARLERRHPIARAFNAAPIGLSPDDSRKVKNALKATRRGKAS